MCDTVLLIVDNRDSFTFNLAEVFAALGAEVRVERATVLDVASVLAQEVGETRLEVDQGDLLLRQAEEVFGGTDLPACGAQAIELGLLDVVS